MPLAFDAASNVAAGGVGPFTVSHTTSAGSDRLMVVGVSWYSPGADVSALTYNGVSLTAIPSTQSDSGDYHVRLYYLIAPASGANTVSLTFTSGAYTGSYDGGMGIVTFTGAHQTVPFGTPVVAAGNSTTPTVDVLSSADELVVDATIITHSGTYSVGAGQTSRWNAIGTHGYIKYSGSTEVGAGPATLSWSNTSSQLWAISAVPVKPVAAGGGSAVPVFMSHRRNQGMS